MLPRLLSALLVVTCGVAVGAKSDAPEATIKKIQGGKWFLMRTGILAATPDATWSFFAPDGTYEAGPETPQEIVRLYQSKDANMKKEGICILCFYHSVPEVEFNKPFYTDFMRECTKNVPFMASLRAMVADLVKHCNEVKIPVWINITPDISGDYKLLTQPIETLEQRTKWTSADGQSIIGRIRSFDETKGTFDLLREDGQLFTGVPLSRLSAVDQAFLIDAAKRELR